MSRYTYITSHVFNEIWSILLLSLSHILTKNCNYIRTSWVRSRSKSNCISSLFIYPTSSILAQQSDSILVRLRICIHKCDTSQKYSEPSLQYSYTLILSVLRFTL
jgi:hypothetical protein